MFIINKIRLKRQLKLPGFSKELFRSYCALCPWWKNAMPNTHDREDKGLTNSAISQQSAFNGLKKQLMENYKDLPGGYWHGRH